MTAIPQFGSSRLVLLLVLAIVIPIALQVDAHDTRTTKDVGPGPQPDQNPAVEVFEAQGQNPAYEVFDAQRHQEDAKKKEDTAPEHFDAEDTSRRAFQTLYSKIQTAARAAQDAFSDAATHAYRYINTATESAHEAGAKGKETVDAGKAKASQLKDSAAKMTDTVAHKASDAGQAGSEKASKAYQAAKDTVSENFAAQTDEL